MAKYLDSTGLTHLWAKIKNYVQTYVSNLNLADTYVAKESGKGLSTNDYTTDEKTKLSNIASGAEVNQNAFSNVKVGSTTVAADAKTDTLTLAAGGDVTITPDATNDKVTISVTTPKKVSDLTNDSGFITLSQVPEGAVASSTTPLQDGTAAVGTETAFARGDHRHPTDTSRAADNDVVHLSTTSIEHIMGAKEFKGNVELGTSGWSQLVDTSSSPSQTLADVIDDLETAIASKADTTNLPKATTTTPKMDGTAAVGSETKWAKGDHVHPTDTSRAADDAVIHNSGNESFSGEKTVIGTLKLQNQWNQIYNLDDDIGLGTVLNQKAPKCEIVTLTFTSTTSATADKTSSQIVASLERGQQVMWVESNGTYLAQVLGIDQGADEDFVYGVGKFAGIIALLSQVGSEVTIYDTIMTQQSFNSTSDVSLVHRTTDENISGSKTFQADQTIASTYKLILDSAKLQLKDQTDWSYIYRTNGNDSVSLQDSLNLKANLASPTFTGTPKAPTATAGTNTTQVATTAFVHTAVGNVSTSSIGAIPESQKGVANGVATLDTNGLIPSTQLPSYVDDVVEVYARSGQTALSQNWFATGSASGTVVTPAAGKIYVLMADSGDYSANSQFRWGSSTYVKLNDGGVSAITNAEIDSITSN